MRERQSNPSQAVTKKMSSQKKKTKNRKVMKMIKDLLPIAKAVVSM